jgi:hypothetical protein
MQNYAPKRSVGALLNPTTRVAAVVVNGVLGALLVAACLAVGSRQPARCFWFGFALACLGTLTIDELGRRKIITPVVFTKPLASMMEEALPPIPPLRGEPGTTQYFRSAGRYPIQYSVLDEDGTTEAAGFMTMEQAQHDGLIDKIGPLEDLPHVDNRPNSHARSTICQYVLASFVGLAGGILSHAVRCRGDRRE